MVLLLPPGSVEKVSTSVGADEAATGSAEKVNAIIKLNNKVSFFKCFINVPSFFEINK